MAGNLNIKNANGKTLTIQNSDTNNADIVIDGSKIASTVSPVLTGNPTAPTQTAGDNSTRLATTAYVDGKMVLSTAVTASGTAIDFTAIPSWVKRITIGFSGVSTTGVSPLQIQLGSGSISASGYSSSNAVIIQGGVGASLFTTGFGVTVSTGNSSASAMLHGSCVINKITSNTYTASGAFGGSHNAVIFHTAGAVTLSDVLDRIRITTVTGMDTFDAGSVNIMYEG